MLKLMGRKRKFGRIIQFCKRLNLDEAELLLNLT